MAKPTSDSWNGCPFRYAATVLGDAWALLILRDLAFKQARHFGDFAGAEEGISTNILSDRLSRLEAEGVIDRAPDPENARRVIYRLTAKGRDLVPVLLAIIGWSEAWDDKTEVPSGFIKTYRDEPDALARSIMNGLAEQAR